MMLRLIYTLLLSLLLPLTLLFFYVKGRKEIGYRQRWRERFACRKQMKSGGVIIHAASVGEVLLIAPLVRQILTHYPDTVLTVTTFTPGGSDQVKKLFGEQVQHCYLPFDLPFFINRFLAQLQPKAFIIVETELWFNLLYQLRLRHIPTFLINARLSAKSAKRYRYFQASLNQVWQGITAVAAQDELSAERYRQLGVSNDKVICSGNLKFDLDLSDQTIEQYRRQKQLLLADRPVWLAASTHSGEETLILAAHQQLLCRYPNLLLILVPRHAARFADVENLLRQSPFSYQKRSESQAIAPTTQILLGDTMGELLKLYALADLAFVGGSLIEHGGHNPLEPLLFQLPLISGKHIFHFKQIYEQLNQLGGVSFVDSSAESLARQVSVFLENQQQAARSARQGFLFLQQNRGAMAKTIQLLTPYLSE